MHKSVEDAFDQIDAAIFSGDTFSTDGEDLRLLEYYLDRWQRAVPDLEDQLVKFLEQGDEEV
jgi:hypothetical protein